METELRDHLQEALGDSYAVEREMPGGTMSRVFLAYERSLGRRVVIKVLPPELSSGVSEARFQREIMVTAGLQHPHILPVLAAGSRDDLLYYVMPYVEGQSLRERLAVEPQLPMEEALTILREVAGALAYAHARGVIHRDVKPENVLLSDGHAILADFGIARALEQANSSDRLTGVGFGVGTPGYMAPEQLAGDPTVNARADVFALGVIGYEMLAGRPPFLGGSRRAVAIAYFKEPPPPLEQLRSGVPPDVARAIGRALARTPDERFSTAAEFREALNLGATGERIAERLRRPRRRFAWLALAVVVLVVAALAGATALGVRARARGGTAAARSRQVLAVLPFKNLGAAEDAYFADGITEEVTTRLAGLAGLGVISRTSTEQYRNSTKPLPQIARELGADYVLEGSVRWDRTPDGRRGRVRVTPQLIRVRDDSHLWAERYDAELSDVFEVQSRIAERVADALAVALVDAERRRMDTRPTESLAAYDSYMRGEQLRVHESASPTALARAAELLGKAVEADPRFALAFAKLALVHQALYDSYFDRTAARRARARAAADSALALDPGSADAHLARGRYFESGGHFDSAISDYAAAERRRPNDSAILARTASVLVRRGRWADALTRFRRAAELDPRSAEANLSAAEAYALTRDEANAARYVERAIAADSHAIAPYLLQARIALTLRGDRAAAGEAARRMVLRFGAERAAAADGFEVLVHALDTAERRTLARVSPSAFDGNRLAYFYWRFSLFDRWDAARARLYADSLLRAGQPLLRDDPDDPVVQSTLAWVLAVLGRDADAAVAARRSLQLMPITRDARSWGATAQSVAATFARMGQADAAIDQLERLLAAPSWVSVPMLRTDPAWDPLRGNPRFERLIKG